MRRGPIRKRQPKAAFQPKTMRSSVLSGISSGFPKLSRSCGQVAHVLLTRPPLTQSEQAPIRSARLACIRHAASVRPEPGSNSPKESGLALQASAAIGSRRFGPAAAAIASSQALQRVSPIGKRPPLFVALRFVQFSRNKLIVHCFARGVCLLKSDSYNISFLFVFVNMFFIFFAASKRLY